MFILKTGLPDHFAKLLIIIQVFNIWRLNHGDVGVVRFDHPDAVDIEAHPHKVAHRRKDHFQVDVVAEYKPEPVHGLKKDDHVHEVDPGQHETANA